jgi:hypothetical protein
LSVSGSMRQQVSQSIVLAHPEVNATLTHTHLYCGRLLGMTEHVHIESPV